VRYRGSRVRSPPVPVVLSVYQRGSLLDGLAMNLSCDTKKLHDNESTHILHNFWTSTHRGEASLFPPGGATARKVKPMWILMKQETLVCSTETIGLVECSAVAVPVPPWGRRGTGPS